MPKFKPDYTFFNVDVETSGRLVGYGKLLTVGIVPVIYKDGWVAGETYYYVRIEQGTDFPDGPYSSMEFWKDQNALVRGEAYADRSLTRLAPDEAAKSIVKYLESFEPDPMRRFFVANPVSFDKPWVDTLMADAGLPPQFHYRSLCLRSMDFGRNPKTSFGESRSGAKSAVLHHALYDAEAQSLDLLMMLNKRYRRFYKRWR